MFFRQPTIYDLDALFLQPRRRVYRYPNFERNRTNYCVKPNCPCKAKMGQKLSKDRARGTVVDLSDSEDVIEIPIQRKNDKENPIEVSDDSDVIEVPVTESQASIMEKIKDAEHALEEQELVYQAVLKSIENDNEVKKTKRELLGVAEQLTRTLESLDQLQISFQVGRTARKEVIKNINLLLESVDQQTENFQ